MQNAECRMIATVGNGLCAVPYKCLEDWKTSYRRTSLRKPCHCEPKAWQSPGQMCEFAVRTRRFPRGFAPRNDGGRLWLVLLLVHGGYPAWSAWAVPHTLRENLYFISKKCLHFPNIHARISNVNIKSIDRVVVFSAHVLRESGAVGATQHGKQGFPPGAAA